MAHVFGSVGQPVRIRKRVPQNMTFEFASFPHTPRHPPAETPRTKSDAPSRKWVAKRVRGYLPGPNRKHAGLIDKISVALTTVSQLVGRCRYPLYLTHSTAAGLFELRRTIWMRRTEAKSRGLIPPREQPVAFEGGSDLS